MLEEIILGGGSMFVLLKVLGSERLIEYLGNYVKKQKTPVISNISDSEFKAFRKASKESAKYARERCSTYWEID